MVFVGFGSGFFFACGFFCLVLGFVFLFKKVFLVGVSNELWCCSCMELIVERCGGIADAVQFVSTTFFCAVLLQSGSSCFEMSGLCDWQ